MSCLPWGADDYGGKGNYKVNKRLAKGKRGDREKNFVWGGGEGATREDYWVLKMTLPLQRPKEGKPLHAAFQVFKKDM